MVFDASCGHQLLDALSFPTSLEVPIVGWLQILVVIALSELWRYENVISKYSAPRLLRRRLWLCLHGYMPCIACI